MAPDATWLVEQSLEEVTGLEGSEPRAVISFWRGSISALGPGVFPYGGAQIAEIVHLDGALTLS